MERRGLDHAYAVDSCGTGGGSGSWYRADGFCYHIGDPADGRMARAARRRGYDLTSRSRPLAPEDLEHSALVVGMEEANLQAIREAARHWQAAGVLAPAFPAPLALLPDFVREPRFKGLAAVPDPYYGGAQGFELVLDLLEDGCESLLDQLELARASV